MEEKGMSTEAKSMWELFIIAPENAALLKRYAKSAKEPAPLFESIGEDLGSTNEEVRATAFWALVAAMPQLTNILHERETRQPKWRDVEQKDQQMVNRGLDILSYLHRVLVKEHHFKIRGRYRNDPRPYVNRAIRNWNIDEDRQRTNRDGTLREMPLDYEASLEIPDPAGSVEDVVLENRALEGLEKELIAWGFLRSENEFDLYRTVYVDESPFHEVRKRLGISSEPALRQRISRARKNIVADRDAIFSALLICWKDFPRMGKLPRFHAILETSEWWVERAKRSLEPGAWANGKVPDGENEVALRPLTRSLTYAPGHIYLVAVHKHCEEPPMNGVCRRSTQLHRTALRLYNLPTASYGTYPLYPLGFGPDYDLDHPRPYVAKLLELDPTSKELQRDHHVYMACRLEAYPTELSGLNDALAEIPHDYHVWLISNSGYKLGKANRMRTSHGRGFTARTVSGV